MSATIQVQGIPATITAGRWVCNDAALLESLEKLKPSSYFPDGVNAREAIANLGGRLISEELEPEDPLGGAEIIPIH